MASTRDYMDYLDDAIGIAPANSQEEFQAAETLVDIMKDHGLEPTIQEFDAHPLGRLMPSIMMVILFVGLVLAGVGGGVVRIVGFVLAIASGGSLFAVHGGNGIFDDFGPGSRSQNVIAVRRASGPKVTKGSRPVVIVAHYDTPRENLLYGKHARYQAPLRRASVPCTCVVAIAALAQILVFLPDVLRIVLWIVGLIASLPLLLLAVVETLERFSPCTMGTNDNKASVAAMLSLLSKVAPARDKVGTGRDGASAEEPSEADGGEPAVQEGDDGVKSNVLGIRHGREVLEQLRILPEGCEIVYEDGRGTDSSSYEGWTADDQAEREGGDRPPAESVDMGDYDTGEGEPDDPEEGNGIAKGGAMPQPGDYSEYDVYAQDYEDDVDSPQLDPGVPTDDPTRESDAGEGLRAKVHRVLIRLRTLLKRGEGDDGRPDLRGSAGEDVDFAEFEETDWGDEDESSPMEDELLPITREEIPAYRNIGTQAQEGKVSSEPAVGADGGYPDEAWDEGPAGPEEQDEYSDGVPEGEEPYEYEEDYQEWDDTSEEPAYEGVVSEEDATEEPVADGDAPLEAQTDAFGHEAISHESGSDWSLVSEERDDEESAAGFDSGLYRVNEEVEDVEYEGEEDDLSAIEELLDVDQLASARPTYRDSGDVAGETAGEATTETQAAEGNQEPGQETVERGYELSWDETADEEFDGADEVDEPEGDPTLTNTPVQRSNPTLVNGARGLFGRIRKGLSSIDEPLTEDEYEYDAHTQEGESGDRRYEDPTTKAGASEEGGGTDDVDDSGVLPKDTRGLDTLSDGEEIYEDTGLLDDQGAPDPIDDPTWGQSSFVPPKPKVNIARRAALFDLPDPSQQERDPLAEPEDAAHEPSRKSDDTSDDTSHDLRGDVTLEDDVDLDDLDDPSDDDEGSWKGGAALRSDLRGAGEGDVLQGQEGDAGLAPETVDDGMGIQGDEAPSPSDQADMQDAILSMGDDDLLAHDVWFVAIGASNVGHAGMRAFLSSFRQELRGAFLINLDSVGAGMPTVLTSEGLHATRRADRRLVRLVTSVADDLHLPLQKEPFDWDETDATPAMRSRVRSVTLMGLDEDNVRALSHTQDDTPENVSPEQVSAIVRLVTEVIRRS